MIFGNLLSFINALELCGGSKIPLKTKKLLIDNSMLNNYEYKLLKFEDDINLVVIKVEFIDLNIINSIKTDIEFLLKGICLLSLGTCCFVITSKESPTKDQESMLKEFLYTYLSESQIQEIVYEK